MLLQVDQASCIQGATTQSFTWTEGAIADTGAVIGAIAIIPGAIASSMSTGPTSGPSKATTTGVAPAVMGDSMALRSSTTAAAAWATAALAAKQHQMFGQVFIMLVSVCAADAWPRPDSVDLLGARILLCILLYVRLM